MALGVGGGGRLLAAAEFEFVVVVVSASSSNGFVLLSVFEELPSLLFVIVV